MSRVRDSVNWIAGEACGHARRVQINVALRNGRKPLAIALDLRREFPGQWPTDHAAEMMVRRWKAGPQFRAWLTAQEDNDQLLRTVEAAELKLGLVGDAAATPEKRLARSLLLQIMSGESTAEEKAAAAASLIKAIGAIDEGRRQDRKLQQADQKLAQADRALDQAQRKLALLEKQTAQAKATVADTKLSAAEQAARLREIFAK